MKKIGVLLFDDSDSIRESISLLIDGSEECALAGSYANAAEAVDKIEINNPDVVLMDIDMPDVNGIEAVKKIHQRFPRVPVIMLTVFDDPEKVFQSLCSGAVGYMLKNTPPAKL